MPDEAEDGNTSLLGGVVLCSTSLSQDLRDKLNDLARSMGAVHRLDLTADVTHLVVGNIDTPKCKHTAKERPDIHALKPEWIHAIRKSYMEDQEIDPEALVQEYRLPAFYNLHICVTGFEDIDQRQDLIQKISNNGAHYHGDLTRDVTHLIVAKPRGAKYERAKTWNLKVVSAKWLEESLERGMAVDESLYHPLMAPEDQGHGAFVRDYQKPFALGKRQRDDPSINQSEELGKRKMRRTASAKLADHSQSMMTSFLSHGGGESSEVAKDQWTEIKDQPPPPRDADHSRSRSESKERQRISRHTSWEAAPIHQEEEPGLFSGVSCLVHGHDDKKTAKIHEIVISNGGYIARNSDAFLLNDDAYQYKILVLPSGWTSTTKGSLPEIPSGTWHATEWWLERCIKQKALLDPASDPLSQPHLSLPIDGPVRAIQQQKTVPNSKGPFIEEDEEETVPDDEGCGNESRLPAQFDGQYDDPPPMIAEDDMVVTNAAQSIQPLQNIPPEVNSTRKQLKSTPSGDISASSSLRKGVQRGGLADDENADVPKAEAVQANQVRLSGEIKSLLERQHSHPEPSPVEQPVKGRWRKDKKLGRAPSYTSNSSASVSFRQHQHLDAVNTGPLANLVEGEAPALSQQVTYETPEAQEYRLKMSKKMGTRLMDDSVGARVESPGLVRDVEASGAAAGVGGRNLSTEINTATRSVHARLNKLIISRLPLALPPAAKTPEAYAHGINTFGDIYLVFENCWRVLIAEVDKSDVDDSSHDNSLRRWLSQLVPPGLWRSEAIKKDLEYLETITGADLEAVTNAQIRTFTEHIYRQTRDKPHVLIAYAWIMYMAIFSGGRWIREQMTNSGPEFWGVNHESDKMEYWVHGTLRPGFTLFCFSGARDGEDIKADFKTRLEEAEELLTAHERQDVVNEAQYIFEQCVAVVEDLDKQLKTDLELVKSLATRGAEHGTADLKTTPTRAALPQQAALENAEPKPANFIRAIVVAFFAFAFYQSYRWQYGDLERD
ncbi:hypothetical protein E4T42_03820 [Aureobasidium subglaciale]|nr:hypothetical protein E4T42_03820 [Aureobasidium subglaciale]